ncbi:bifunctional adenosylcobinamide kinase/adenosylcobinamide-phosphate guanylyltransferase [Chloroflexota bacterium]
MSTVLLLGGARSGKSSKAEQMARQSDGPVLFVATAQAFDDEMKRRIAAHREVRPPEWQTLEAPGNIAKQLSQKAAGFNTVIIDCITLLVSNIVGSESLGDEQLPDTSAIEEKLDREINGVVDCIAQFPARFIIVSNEVGLGLVPEYPAGRLYRDLLGRANQMLAEVADEVFFMVAGQMLKVKPQ